MLNLKKSIFLMVCLMAAVVANAWTGGNMEPENSRKIGGKIYYELTNADELAWFAVRVNEGDTVNAIMVNDIDIAGYEWTPIGNAGKTFEGVFNGAGYTISGIACTNNGEAGIFGTIGENGVVKNLKTAGGSVGNAGGTAGGIAAVNKGLIDSCENDVTLLKTMYAGGIAGKNEGKVAHSINKHAVEVIDGGTFYVGGISAYNTGLIETCNNDAEITYVGSEVWAGGIAGFSSGSILRSNNAKSLPIKSTRPYSYFRVGGIVGENQGNVSYVTNRGDVSAYMDYRCGYELFHYVGGVVGVNSGSVSETLNAGNVSSGGAPSTSCGDDTKNSWSYVGGIVGHNKENSTIENSYSLHSRASIDTGYRLVYALGGVVGMNEQKAQVINSYHNSSLWGGSAVGNQSGVAVNTTGKITEQMTTDQFAWILNTSNGDSTNSGAWTRNSEENGGFPIFVTDSTDYRAVYKIIFNDDGAKTNRYTNYMGKVTLPADPEPEEGMVFVAWVDAAGRAVRMGTIFTKDVTVNAVYKSASALTNVVTFLDENDEELFAYVTDESGKLSSLPEAPAPAEGYYFKGWYDEEFNRVNETTVFKANATLKALYGELSDVSYTITFKNADGTVLQTKTVKHGSIPEYTGAAPALEATAQYSYTFAAWDAAIVPATDDVVYTATYNATINSYTISFVDFDDSEIWSNVQPYGSSVVFGGVIPTRETTVAYSYVFKSWDKAVGNVTADATYKAVYDSTAITYEVVFKNGSVVLSTQQVEYGKAATAPASPTREGYLFSGWDKSFSKITTDLVVNALFDLAPTHQLIVYVDGEVVIETAPAEGSEYTLPSAVDKNGHTFLGWYDAEGNKLGDAGDKITIVDDITITAKYEINKYTITFMFGSTKLQSSQVEYNKMPTYDGVEPSREKTAAYTYTFAGWTPVVSAATKDETYTAVFDSTLNKFTIVFKSAGGTLQTKSVAYGTVPTYTGEEPAKDPTAQYEYSFAGWTPEITSVTAAKTYTAIFDSTLRAYKVTFKVDGEVVQSKSVFYGSTPVYSGDEPSRAKSENYTYEFAGWTPKFAAVTGPQTYTAVFDSTKIVKPASSSSVPNSSSSSGKGESSSSNKDSSSSSGDKGNSSSSDKTALDMVWAAPQFNVEVVGRTLQVAGAKNGAVYNLMDMQGRLLKQGSAAANFTIEVPRAGSYLLRIGKSISRVNVY